MVLVALLGIAVAYWAGSRAQRYGQARADVRDNRVKLRKARTARSAVRRAAMTAWVALGALVVLATVVGAARAHR